MEGQRDKLNGNRRRRRRAKGESKAQSAPILIAARRPDSPRLGKISRRNIAASARPKRPRGVAPGLEGAEKEQELGPEEGEGAEVAAPQANAGSSPEAAEKPRRVARIVAAAAPVSTVDQAQQRRERLLDRLITCEGRSAISRIADELLESGGVPEEQPYQIQLLEHVDELLAGGAVRVLARLFDRQQPIKRPILDQRLRRLEEEADDVLVRAEARELRRRLRASSTLKPAHVS